MPIGGPQPERHDSSIGLLAHFQNLFTSAWTAHADQHTLEDKALQIALERVADTTAALDKALALALVHVDQSHGALRDLLSGRIDALKEVVQANEHASHLRIREAASALEALTETQHTTSQRREDAAWDAHLRAHAIVNDAHKTEHELVQLAVEKAEASVALRLDGLNEARARAIDERDTFATKDRLDDLSGALAARVARLETVAASSASSVVTRDQLDDRLNAANSSVGATASQNAARIGALERQVSVALGAITLLVFLVPLGIRLLSGG